MNRLLPIPLMIRLSLFSLLFLFTGTLVAQDLNLPFALSLSVHRGGAFSLVNVLPTQIATEAGYQRQTANRRYLLLDEVGFQLGMDLPHFSRWRVGVSWQVSRNWRLYFDKRTGNTRVNWGETRSRDLRGVWLDYRLLRAEVHKGRRWGYEVGGGAFLLATSSTQNLFGWYLESGQEDQVVQAEFRTATPHRLPCLGLRSSASYFLAPFLAIQGRVDGWLVPSFSTSHPQPQNQIPGFDGTLPEYPTQLSSLNLMLGFLIHLE